MKNTKLKTINLISLGLLAFSWAEIAKASAIDTVIGGFAKTGQNAGYQVGADGKPAVEFVPAWSRYLNGMLTLMGALFMVNIIYAGWLWFSAKGNEEQVGRAKNMMINATIGLAVILAARLIVELVLITLGTTVKTS